MNRVQKVHLVFPSVNRESTFVKAKKLTLLQYDIHFYMICFSLVRILYLLEYLQ